MNNQMFQPVPNPNYGQNMFTPRLNNIERELKRLERRIYNLEKTLIPTPINEINPTPLNNNLDYTNDNYFL